MAKEASGKRHGGAAFPKKAGEADKPQKRDPLLGQLARTKASREAVAVFPTPEEFQAVADAYFDDCDERGILYGEAGLALYLSKHNVKGRTVTLRLLRLWYDGTCCPVLQDAVQTAYLRIQDQIETDDRYREKGMVTRGIFLQKQTRLGGYQDKIEQKNDTTVRIVHGDSVDESDFG